MLPVIVPSASLHRVGRSLEAASKLRMTNLNYAVIDARLSSRLVAVDATPNGAVVWVSAQPIRFVKVIGIGLWPCGWEHSRSLRDSGAHIGKVLMSDTRRVRGRNAGVL